MEHINEISQKVYSEPTTVELRPALVQYILFYIDQAKSASRKELLHSKIGSEIASNICGSLAWQGADGVDGDDWISQATEPVLWEMLVVTSALDVNHDNISAWQKLFSLAKKL